MSLEDREYTLNDISGVLKLFFDELPEPLCTWESFSVFVDIQRLLFHFYCFILLIRNLFV